jgi:hypothetical protein
MNQCDEKHRSPTPKHAATAGIWRHEREGISYPSVEAEDAQAPSGERVGSRAAHRTEADHDHIVLGGHH